MAEVTLDSLARQMERLLEGQEAVRAEVAGLREAQGELRADLIGRLDRVRADLMARMDRLQERLTAGNEESIVNLGVAERAERIARNASEEIRLLSEEVHALHRMVLRLESQIRDLRGEH